MTADPHAGITRNERRAPQPNREPNDRPKVVGVLRETATGEQRVALTPGDARRLIELGLPVVVQTGAGTGAGFDDSAYDAAGARLVASPTAVFELADLITWVKPPAFELEAMPLRSGHALIGFHDPITRAEPIARLAARGIGSVAFEHVSTSAHSDADGLSAMSEIAGEIAYDEGLALLAANQHRGRVRTLVLGCGHAGLSAIAAAARRGERPVAVGIRQQQEATAVEHGAGRFVLNPAIPALLAEVPFNLVICAAVRRGEPAPKLLRAAELAMLRPGAVVIDLAGKAGGNCDATELNSTVTLPSGVIVTHRSNYPARRPVTASHAYSAAVVAMVLSALDRAIPNSVDPQGNPPV